MMKKDQENIELLNILKVLPKSCSCSACSTVKEKAKTVFGDKEYRKKIKYHDL